MRILGSTLGATGTLLTVALAAVFSAGTLAQETPGAERNLKSVRVTRVDSPPIIDGKLDEAVWQQADVIDDFHQIRPGDGAEPSDRTEIYLLYDENALYVGARMWDSEPDRITANILRHNLRLGADDRISVILDPFNTRRGGYRFETNANGVRHDMLYQNVSQTNAEWSVIWDVESSIDEHGWVAEMAIPFKTLPFDPGIDTWGINFARAIRRRGEEVVWVSRNRSYNPAIVGLATGFRDMDQGIGLDIVPSLSVNQQRIYSPSASDSDMHPSLDLFYRITPSLNASLTINTDFSATEVDDRQVNLTRFSLFFPEKRDFFLNDADLFDFGRIGGRNSRANRASSRPSRENARPFFSRGLGLSRSGTPVDLEYGGKLSGRMGQFTVGALAMRQGEFESVNAGNVFVGRVTANVLEESAVGVIVTDGDPNSNLSNSLMGADFRYLNTRLPGGRVMEADVWFQQSDTEGLAGEDSALGFGVSMPNNTGFRGGLAVKEVEENFKPALGFVNRSNVRDVTVDIGYTHFVTGEFLQSVFGGIDVQRISFLGGGLQSQTLIGRLLELDTRTRDSLDIRYRATKEVVTEPFSIYEDDTREVIIPAGEYSFDDYAVQISTGTYRKLSGNLSYQDGDFLGGQRRNVSGSFSWKHSRHFILGVSYDWNDIELPQGRFITRLIGLTIEAVFSSTLSWVNFIQYDNVSEVLGINSRLHWIPRAGQEAFIVLNHNLQDVDKDNSFHSTFSDLSIKFNYTFRF